jgi:hypothetical protein
MDGIATAAAVRDAARPVCRITIAVFDRWFFEASCSCGRFAVVTGGLPRACMLAVDHGGFIDLVGCGG